MLEEEGCLSGFRVREELDKIGGFFAPSSSRFYAKDEEATSSAAHEFGVCTWTREKPNIFGRPKIFGFSTNTSKNQKFLGLLENGPKVTYFFKIGPPMKFLLENGFPMKFLLKTGFPMKFLFKTFFFMCSLDVHWILIFGLR